MVFIEEVEAPLRKALGAKFAPPAAGVGKGEYAAFVVTGAGWEDANGCYAPTGKVLFEAPVYENDHKCLLSRESHNNSRTGKSSFGWILGQDRKPLYAVETDALTPPATGWLLFSGTSPVPRVQGMGSVPDAATLAAQNWKDLGNAYFGAQKYHEAEAKWTRGLCLAAKVGDESLPVALYSNRAEARLRMKRWEDALDDAQAALRRNATHEKALLRAAVAARELKSYGLAQGFVQDCLDAHPRSAEAKQLLLDLEQLVHFASQAPGGDGKLKEQWLKKTTEENLPKAFATKDVNSKKGFKAFGGYASSRKGTVEKPPISALPYHFMGLPPDKVAETDMLYEEMRSFREAKEKMRRRELEEYAEVKRSYKIRADEDEAMGKLVPLEEIMPAVRAKELAGKPGGEGRAPAVPRAKALTPLQASKQQAERVELPASDRSEIDALFGGFASRPAADDAAAEAAARQRKERLARARGVVSGRGKDVVELAKENASKEEAEKKKAEAAEKKEKGGGDDGKKKGGKKEKTPEEMAAFQAEIERKKAEAAAKKAAAAAAAEDDD
mmetsp:Transcript_84225/g.233446  ORF Transcript_84225/g.233446 Transcript_84225/m.233446 type:complete len:556 (+) Transcript_84225:75-1742(+)